MKTFVDLLNDINIDKFDLLHEDENLKFFGLTDNELRMEDDIEHCFVFSKKTKRFITNYCCFVTKYESCKLYHVIREDDYQCQLVDLEGNFLFDEWKREVSIDDCRRLFKGDDNLLKISCFDTDNKPENYSRRHYNIWSKQNSKFVFDEWFDGIYEIDKETYCIVVYKANKGYNILNNKCEYLSTKWFERFLRTSSMATKNCFYYKGLWLYLNNNGKLIYGDAMLNNALNNLGTKLQ